MRADLQGYKGRVAVMSFNPEIGCWFARYALELRGLVVTEAEVKWMAEPPSLAGAARFYL